MASMDAIVEVNLEDRYVTVEARCSWQKLHEHLAPLGVLKAYWGTLSGRYATIGGGLWGVQPDGGNFLVAVWVLAIGWLALCISAYF